MGCGRQGQMSHLGGMDIRLLLRVKTWNWILSPTHSILKSPTQLYLQPLADSQLCIRSLPVATHRAEFGQDFIEWLLPLASTLIRGDLTPT
jgi:hypothetical protein